MARRLDNTQKLTRVLFAALIVAALVIPACMSLSCFGASMSDTGMAGMPSMPLSECLDSALANDGLVALEMQQAVTMLALAVFFGLALVILRGTPRVAMGRAANFRAVEPPPPLDPRGERFLI